MANPEHLAILKQGVKVWNRWREDNSDIRPELSEADFSYADLSGANLSEADLSYADLSGANLSEADFSYADLSGANLTATNVSEVDLTEADLTGAILSGAELRCSNLSGTNLTEVNLSGTNLTEVNLSGSDLTAATLIGTNMRNATLSACRIYGISAWNLNLEGAVQKNLVITNYNEPQITVDNLEIAQFMYMLLHSEKLRSVINALTTKSVLILGRFTDERKAVLDALRDHLRERGYIPILFDFEKPANRDLTETISTLAHLSRFIIADITDARSIPQELQAIVPNLPSVAVQPIILSAQEEYGMFEHFKRYNNVLPVFRYDTPTNLLAALVDQVINPAEAKADEMQPSPPKPPSP